MTCATQNLGSLAFVTKSSVIMVDYLIHFLAECNVETKYAQKSTAFIAKLLIATILLFILKYE